MLVDGGESMMTDDDESMVTGDGESMMIVEEASEPVDPDNIVPMFIAS
jgi:hypothetical protein